MDTYGFAVIATGIVLFGLISRRLATSLVTAPMLFTAFGLAIGDATTRRASGASSAPSRNKLSTSGRRDARPARREERAYRAYVRDEQRRRAGCIGGQMSNLFLLRAVEREVVESDLVRRVQPLGRHAEHPQQTLCVPVVESAHTLHGGVVR